MAGLGLGHPRLGSKDVDARDTNASTRVFDALLPAHDGDYCRAANLDRPLKAHTDATQSLRDHDTRAEAAVDTAPWKGPLTAATAKQYL